MDHTDAPLANHVVLLIEDDWLLRQSMAEVLSEAGCQLLEASTGEYAVNLLAEDQAIDLVITDIQLAGALTGWDVAERARALRPDLPVIYTTGVPPLENRQVPASIFLSKPVAPAAIITVCAQLLKRG